MDKAFLLYVLIGIGFLYLITNFVGDIQAEDDKYANQAYAEEHKYDKYKSMDNVERPILDLKETDLGTQIKIWNSSQLKNEFISFFPDYEAMRTFVTERIKGTALSQKLFEEIDRVEEQYVSGTMSIPQVKETFLNLK